jgi:hypothetical protein
VEHHTWQHKRRKGMRDKNRGMSISGVALKPINTNRESPKFLSLQGKKERGIMSKALHKSK